MRNTISLVIFGLLFVIGRPASAEEPERVILKLEEFLKMYDKSKKPVVTPPRDHAIASARYRAQVILDDGKPHAAMFRTRMRVSVLRRTGWARVPVLPATVALQSAKIGGREAPVVIEGGFYTLVTDRRGDFDLDLVFAAAVTTAEGSSQVSFQLTPSGATELEFAVPADQDLDFTVAGARVQSDKVVGGKRVVDATLPATGSLTVSWQREIPTAAKQKPRVYAEVYTLAGVSDGVMRATTNIQQTILFAGVDTMTFKVPKGMTLLDVKGAGIRDWKLAPDGTLTVLLNFAAEGSYELSLELEKAIGKAAKGLTAPIVVPQGVERTKGWIGVETRGNLEVAASKVTDATPVDVRSLPAAILGITDQPVLLGYKYLSADPSIALDVTQHDEVDVLVTLVDKTIARTMWTRKGRRLTSVKYQVRNNRRQFLRLALPKGATLWSASVAGQAVQPAKGSDGKVMLPLIRSQRSGRSLTAFEVEVVYVESGVSVDRRGRGRFQASLPIPDAPSTYVAWTVYSPDKTKVRRLTIDGTLREVKSLSDPIPSADLQFIDTGLDARTKEARRGAGGGGQGDYAAQAAAPAAKMPVGAANAPSNSAIGSGAAPVMVALPLRGVETYFEKMLALDEQLTVEFGYRGLRK